MKVYNLIITHRHGTDYRLCVNQEIVDRELLKYVKQNWYELMERGCLEDKEQIKWTKQEEKGVEFPLMPKKPSKAIDFYFDRHGDEYYELDETAVIME